MVVNSDYHYPVNHYIHTIQFTEADKNYLWYFQIDLVDENVSIYQ